MSEIVKGPWPDPVEREEIPGSDWPQGLFRLHQAIRTPAFRPLTAQDQQALWHWLHLALWAPPSAGPQPFAVLEEAQARIFAEDWGRPADLGFVAAIDATDIGACWMRVLPPGTGPVELDEQTPQLALALAPEHRRRGYGKALTKRTLHEAWDRGHSQVSVAVHPLNPAVALFEACGFRKLAGQADCLVMIARVGGQRL